MRCRHCGSTHMVPFLDLGTAPPSNSYVDLANRHMPELWYQLVIR